jgi:zinc protease
MHLNMRRLHRKQDLSVPGNYVEQQSTILKNISKEELNALAKKWLNVDKMNILLVGDKDKVMEGLKKLNYEIDELDVDGKVKK